MSNILIPVFIAFGALSVNGHQSEVKNSDVVELSVKEKSLMERRNLQYSLSIFRTFLEPRNFKPNSLLNFYHQCQSEVMKPKRFDRKVSHHHAVESYESAEINKKELHFWIPKNLPPCACESTIHLHELGRKYFPKFLPVADCKTYRCFINGYTCQTQKYNVKVLRKREEEDIEPDLLLPESLRNDWVCEEITVPVACQCMLEK